MVVVGQGEPRGRHQNDPGLDSLLRLQPEKATAKLHSFRYTPLRTPISNFLAVWPSLFAVSLGLMAVVPTLGLFLEDRFGLRGEELQTWTGWTFAAAPLTAAMFGPLWGILGDRLGRKVMLVRASLAIGLASALVPLAPSPGWVVVCRVLQGAFAGFIAPALALGLTGVPRARQGHALGRMQLALALGLLVGPAVGGEIAATWGRAAVFYFTSVLSVAAALPVILFAKEDLTQLVTDRGQRPPFWRDLRELMGSRVFVVLLMFIFLLRFGQHMVEPYIALWVTELGAHPLVAALVDDPDHAIERTIALAFGVLALGQLLCTTWWGRMADWFGPLRCLAAVGVSLSILFFATAVMDDIESFMWLRCIAAVFTAGSMTLAYAAVSCRVRPECRTLAFSLVQSGIQFGLSLGPVVGDLFAGGWGMRGLYGAGGVCLAVAGLGMIGLRVFSVTSTGRDTALAEGPE